MTIIKNTSKHFKLKIGLIVASSLAIALGLVGLINIYNNNKTDGFNNGQITVTSCREKDRAWRVYSCTGDYFSTGGGMVERAGVSVTVFTREYKSGEIVPDVYPSAFSSNETANHFVTGRERASVVYNSTWLIAVFAGLVLPIITVSVFIASDSKRKPVSSSNE